MLYALSFFIPQPVPPDELFFKIRLFSTQKCYTLRGGLVILYATATRTAFAVRVLPFVGFLYLSFIFIFLLLKTVVKILKLCYTNLATQF